MKNPRNVRPERKNPEMTLNSRWGLGAGQRLERSSSALLQHQVSWSVGKDWDSQNGAEEKGLERDGFVSHQYTSSAGVCKWGCPAEDWQCGPAVLQENHGPCPPGLVAAQGTGTPRRNMLALAWKAQEGVRGCESDGLESLRWAKELEDKNTE